MDCTQCRDVVSARLDGEATASEEPAADAHLSGCPSCRHEAERTADVTRWARLAPAAVGPDLVESVMARVFGPPSGITPAADVAPVAGTSDLAPVVASLVPASLCGCDPSCRCGCQEGRACRCERGAA